MKYSLTYKSFGKQAILIEWPAEIKAAIGDDIIQFQYQIKHSIASKIADAILGYHSLTLTYNDEIHDVQSEIKKLKLLYAKSGGFKNSTRFLWQIPVCYDAALGIDLKAVANTLHLTVQEVIKRHTAPRYRVFFIGFLPGFLYLGGMDARLAMQRKSNPRLKVSKGAVGIGGSQTGIYPAESAGGWNIIGQTPISLFSIDTSEPCFVNPGDAIEFVAIDLDAYRRIEQQVLQRTYEIQKTALDD